MVSSRWENTLIINKTGVDLTMGVYDYKKELIKQFVIPNDRQVSTDSLHQPLPPASFHFFGAGPGSGPGVFVVLRFVDNTCKCFIKNSRKDKNKVFDSREYDNYSEELAAMREYTLFFTFNESDRSDLFACDL